MSDVAYFIESADIRLPNACPERRTWRTSRCLNQGVKACLGCGKAIIVKDRRVKFCTECRVKRDDHTTICEVCGKPFKRTGYSKAYSCPECRTADFTWKPREFTTESVKDVNCKAMHKGMSYGQYMAKYGKRGERH